MGKFLHLSEITEMAIGRTSKTCNQHLKGFWTPVPPAFENGQAYSLSPIFLTGVYSLATTVLVTERQMLKNDTSPSRASTMNAQKDI